VGTLSGTDVDYWKRGTRKSAYGRTNRLRTGCHRRRVKGINDDTIHCIKLYGVYKICYEHTTPLGRKPTLFKAYLNRLVVRRFHALSLSVYRRTIVNRYFRICVVQTVRIWVHYFIQQYVLLNVQSFNSFMFFFFFSPPSGNVITAVFALLLCNICVLYNVYRL